MLYKVLSNWNCMTDLLNNVIVSDLAIYFIPKWEIVQIILHWNIHIANCSQTSPMHTVNIWMGILNQVKFHASDCLAHSPAEPSKHLQMWSIVYFLASNES